MKNLATFLLAMALVLPIAGQTVNKPQPPSRLDNTHANKKRKQRNALFLPKRTAKDAADRRSPTLRATADTRILLDSTVTRMNLLLEEVDQKTVYQYNSAGNIILEIDYDRDPDTQDWVETQREGYDTQGRNIRYESKYYSEYEETIVGYKYEYVYDNQDRKTLFATYSWNNTLSIWVGESKYESAFDDNGNQIMSISYEWDNTLPDWKIYEKGEYAYDDKNREILYTSYSWEDNQWKEIQKRKKDYLSEGNKTYVTGYYWNYKQNDWTMSDESLYEETYDNATGIHTHIEWSKIWWNEVWIPNYKREYKRDEQDRELWIVFYYWNENEQRWVCESKEEAAYDANGRQTLYTWCGWNDNSEEWFCPSKWESEYDDNGNEIRYTNYRDLDGEYRWEFDANNYPKTMSLYVTSDGTQVWYGSTTFYYSQHEVSGITTPSANALHVWISDGQLYIEGNESQADAQVSIYNLSGECIINTTANRSISVSHLPQGIYLVRVNGKTVKALKK